MQLSYWLIALCTVFMIGSMIRTRGINVRVMRHGFEQAQVLYGKNEPDAWNNMVNHVVSMSLIVESDSGIKQWKNYPLSELRSHFYSLIIDERLGYSAHSYWNLTKKDKCANADQMKLWSFIDMLFYQLNTSASIDDLNIRVCPRVFAVLLEEFRIEEEVCNEDSKEGNEAVSESH